MNLTETRDIPGAGRGVVAKSTIPAGTVVHESGPPVCHVIFRAYRKEVCAQCFDYRNGRTLPVRDNDADKVFCSPVCREDWVNEQDVIGLQSWRSLATFIRARAKYVIEVSDASEGELRPNAAEIDSAWARAESKASQTRQRTTVQEFGKSQSKKTKSNAHSSTQAVRSDLLAYFLSAVQTYNRSQDEWNREVLGLAMDDTPYKSHADLEDHCNAFVQLASILPAASIENLPQRFGRVISNADNHNAFGINSGGEDLEEHMGYAVYPSASYFNHSCAPNIIKRRKGRIWTFVAARVIRPGEECCITYLGGDERSMDVAARRARLCGNWGFECRCVRCLAESSGQDEAES